MHVAVCADVFCTDKLFVQPHGALAPKFFSPRPLDGRGGGLLCPPKFAAFLVFSSRREFAGFFDKATARFYARLHLDERNSRGGGHRSPPRFQSPTTGHFNLSVQNVRTNLSVQLCQPMDQPRKNHLAVFPVLFPAWKAQEEMCPNSKLSLIAYA